MMPEKKKFRLLTSKEICQIYESLLKRNLIFFPLSSENISKVDTIVANANATYFGVDTYSTIEEKVVAYLYFLIKNHPFTDGNKRTAISTFKVLTKLNNITPDKSTELDKLAIFIEKTESDHREVIKAVAQKLFR